MQAIILAAGMGKRLKSLTANNTKCMVRLNGVTLIERMLVQLDSLGLERIVMVVGYQAARLIDFVATLDIATPIEFIENPAYDRTNNIYSLSLASGPLCEDDTLLLESDLVLGDGILEGLVADPRPTLALVDRYESWMDGTVVRLDGDDRIDAFVPGNRMDFSETSGYYKTVNVYKFSRDFSERVYVPFLQAYASALGENEYYEQVLRVVTAVDHEGILARRLAGEPWYEIDDLQDLDIAESIFAPDDAERARLVSARYGGYWRYPKMLDFCYLVNPYFPPQRLVDEMSASLRALLTQYPSGMRVNSLLAAKSFGVKQGRIVVGNGAAELIKALFEGCGGKVGVIRPTFEEYPNRLGEGRAVVFEAQAPDFSYTADDLMAYFSGRGISHLVLINPDNPSGTYMSRPDVERLAAWCECERVRLVYDESFSDFADEPGNSLLDDDVLSRFPSLVVVKSISKSYGVPGARLGVLASSDEPLVASLKSAVSIWNVNSFGEFFLQVMEKYAGDYRRSLGLLRAERARFIGMLAAIPGVRPLSSQANYVMCELTGAVEASELTRRLLCEESMLIKDLTDKVGPRWVRLAVRDETDDDRLVAAMRRILAEG